MLKCIASFKDPWAPPILVRGGWEERYYVDVSSRISVRKNRVSPRQSQGPILKLFLQMQTLGGKYLF